MLKGLGEYVLRVEEVFFKPDAWVGLQRWATWEGVLSEKGTSSVAESPTTSSDV